MRCVSSRRSASIGRSLRIERSGRPTRLGAKLDVGVMLERLGDRPLGLAQGPIAGLRRPRQGAAQRLDHEPVRLRREPEPTPFAGAAYDPAGGAGEADQLIGLAAARARAELGGEAGGQRQLQPEGQRRRQPRRAVGAAVALERLGAVEDREVAAEQVVGGRVRLLGVAEAQDGVARPRGGAERGAVGAQVRMRLDRVRAGHRRQVAAALVQDQVEAEERLQPPAEARARLANALGDRVDPSPRGAVQVQDPIGLAVADRAQDHRLGLELARHPHTLPRGPDATVPPSD